ncbi:ATP-binding protein [Glycomyces sp. YM15]|uniref:ATP-binding protein n=1 Tax=Glycomyces sp. YM15 TaxID=2800446 RepID=UPI0019622D80|nr:ATP-binding protein [Glycomyces sp. YM15]
MKITPSARILKMLGEIEFDEWQCIAELVDNAFDDFSEIVRSGVPWAGGYKVIVTLPSAKGRTEDATIVVSDTGSGMSRDRLEQSVRAGWSSNDRFDKLGLFGMGFNVSTARLGRRTRVLSTRAGDPDWIGVDIDLDSIGDDFEAEDIVIPKDDPNEHGTKIEISRLHSDRAQWLRRNESHLREALGGVYSWILEERPFELWIQGKRVKPRRHCRWGDERFVMYGNGASAERIPAYIPIDEPFEPAEACGDCGNWQELGRERCSQCDGDNLHLRERRIWGWLGIQRHLDKREFGVDFIRNGRKILRWDKRVFEWKNMDAPGEPVEIEYPIEMAHQGGRIIGEIHLDHVPVTYQKNAFDYGDRGWRAAIEFLRGEGPLQPKRAQKLGYSENSSHLGTLYRGFRRNDAGKRYLVPGDGRMPIHDQTRQWAQLFHRGDLEFQNDGRWWEAVLSHEAQKETAKQAKVDAASPVAPNEAAVLEALGFGGPTPQPSNEDREANSDTPAGTKPLDRRRQTAQERLDAYRADAVRVPELSRDFGLPKVGNLEIETLRLRTMRLRDDLDQETPVLFSQGAGGTGTVFLDPAHEAFTLLGTEPADFVLAEVAAVLKVKSGTELTLSQMMASIRRQCLPDTVLRVDIVLSQARELLGEVRRSMAAAIDTDPVRAYELLSPDELTSLEGEMIADGMPVGNTPLGETSEFLQYAPALYLVRLLETWPEAFMDGKVFSSPYTTVSSVSARRLSLARVSGYLNDIAALVSFASDPGAPQLRRIRLSLQLLSASLETGL